LETTGLLLLDFTRSQSPEGRELVPGTMVMKIINLQKPQAKEIMTVVITLHKISIMLRAWHKSTQTEKKDGKLE
jgi:hypothetical protein